MTPHEVPPHTPGQSLARTQHLVRLLARTCTLQITVPPEVAGARPLTDTNTNTKRKGERENEREKENERVHASRVQERAKAQHSKVEGSHLIQ